MSDDGPAPGTLAARLLDAQVAHHLAELEGEALAATVHATAEAVLDAAGRHQLADLVDRDALADVVERALTTVPGSAAVAGFVELARDVVRAGPAEPYPVGDVVDREQVAALVDALLALGPAAEPALDKLTASPQVAAMASRFMARIAVEVVQANQAVANKLPGLGSLMSLGTSAATLLVGAADKQLEGALGDAVGRGGGYAVGRMNRILLDTLRDPTTREAVLQMWDLVAAQPVRGLDRLDDDTAAAVDAVVEAGHDLAVTALAHPHVVALGHAVVDAFLDRFGGYTPVELLAELDLDPADLVADLVRFAPGVVDALRESGDLEQILRDRLAPFYASDAVAQLLADG